jgi:AsmA protein
MYDGFGKATVEIDASGDIPVFRETLTLERVRMYQLLNDLVGVDRIDGDGDVTLDLTARGDTPEALLSSLAGRGALRIVGGNLRGANLIGVARIVRGLMTAETLASALGESRGTDFSELGASFTVSDGVLRTNDINMIHAAFRMTGRGSVDLADRTMDLRLEPRTPANTRLALPDIGIPFRVTGPWDDLSYRPDYERLPAGVVRGLTEQPGRVLRDPLGTLESLIGR